MSSWMRPARTPRVETAFPASTKGWTGSAGGWSDRMGGNARVDANGHDRILDVDDARSSRSSLAKMALAGADASRACTTDTIRWGRYLRGAQAWQPSSRMVRQDVRGLDAKPFVGRRLPAVRHSVALGPMFGPRRRSGCAADEDPPLRKCLGIIDDIDIPHDGGGVSPDPAFRAMEIVSRGDHRGAVPASDEAAEPIAP